jgi:guanylate cyclase
LSAFQINLFFVINFVGVGMLIFLMVYYFVQRKNVYQERSELLLLNILPKEIVDVLREEYRTVVDYYDHASILFADLVNFTTISATMTPKELLELLNEVFTSFDKMAEKYGLEKIKTIGDCYMVASGVPSARVDHAEALTVMALDMRDYIVNQPVNGKKLHLRIGINSGPVVAGVIGHKKFSYDLWGDAVNTASRMESHGEVDTIQISQTTYELIKDSFNCISKGAIQVKGKGAMNIWSVISKRN